MDSQLADEAILSTLGERIGHERLQRNQTQSELAHEAGVSVSTIRRLEAGKGCALGAFVRVLRALGLLENLDALLPEPRQRPLEAFKSAGKSRQRARKNASSESSAQPGELAAEGFQWGDEASDDSHTAN